jgi:prevent-host-death family protein
MKVVGIQDANLKECVRQAQRQRVVLTRNGKPVAVLVGVKGLDLEQIALGHSDAFWKLIKERRSQETISRAELEKRLTEE